MKKTLLRMEQILIRILRLKEEICLQPKPILQEEEVWLDKYEVTALLRISASSFYRKLKIGKWAEKEIAGRKYYLKSSIIKP
ncbi:hypothetical protein [Pedobacter gandavensis]|uniref:hypothetical protein n=1 Tax=Pedobacter gandavensis TaxID=2679963 RepID=UPI00292F62EA|nr:hypothetical protein [Pedobacter gandavensis]